MSKLKSISLILSCFMIGGTALADQTVAAPVGTPVVAPPGSGPAAAAVTGAPSAAPAAVKPTPPDIQALVKRADACAAIWSSDKSSGGRNKFPTGDAVKKKEAKLKKNRCSTLAANVISTCLKYGGDPQLEHTCQTLLLQTAGGAESHFAPVKAPASPAPLAPADQQFKMPDPNIR